MTSPSRSSLPPADVIEKEINRVSSRRWIWRLVLSVSSLCAVALLTAAPAAAAPALEVEISHTPSTMPRNDELMSYLLKVRNAAPPAVSSEVGDSLTCEPRFWFPVESSPAHPTFTFEWLRDGSVIPNATSTTYDVAAADAGKALQCIVIGTNANARTKFASLNPVRVDPPTGGGPPMAADPTSAASRPAISGTGTNARTCSVPGNWEVAGTAFNDPADFTFQWLRNGEPIAGATTGSYTPVAEDTGKILQCEVIGKAAGGKTVGISNNSAVGTVSQPPNNTVANTPAIANPNGSVGEVTLDVELPAGQTTEAFKVVQPVFSSIPPDGWDCTSRQALGAVSASVTCNRSDPLAPLEEYPAVEIVTRVGVDTPDPMLAEATVSGGGSAPASATDEFHFEAPTPFGIESLEARALDAAGNDYTLAGGHPEAARVSFDFTHHVNRGAAADAIEFARQILTDVPRGFIGNPGAVPQLCATVTRVLEDKFSTPTCPRSSIVGMAELRIAGEPSAIGTAGPNHLVELPVYAVKPEAGAPAQFVILYKLLSLPLSLIPRLRPSEDYAISIESPQAPRGPAILGATVTLCSFGANVVGSAGFEDTVHATSCKRPSDAEASPEPLLTNPTECSSTEPITTVSVDSWQHPDVWHSKSTASPKITGCEEVPFSPRVDLRPTSHRADSPTGLDVSISVPTEGLESPTGISQSALKKAVVTLPQGMAVNPSAADGLGACALGQIKLGTNDPVQCPESSKIGTAEVVTPLLAEHLNGNVYLARQGDNPFHSLLALYLVVESKERGILVKIPGKVEADPTSGRLVATFDDNPQVPFSSLKLHFNEGNRAPLLNPPACGSYGIVSQLSPWSAPGEPRTSTSTFQVTEGPNGGACPNGGLAPKLEAGLQNPVAGTTSPFTLRLSREDGTQRFRALDVTMPPGLTAYLKGVPYCPDSALASVSEAEGTGRAQIEHPACPAASQIGTVSVGAGGGSNPFYVNTGRAYLAGPYKGAPLSIAIITPAVAGPFDLGSVVVRSAVHVDPETARITVDSDPIPTILHGIPLDVRDIRVNVDRPHFTLAPTSCEAKSVAVRVTGEGGATASPSNHFQVGDCAALPFKPKLKLQLKGATKRIGHPALKAVVTYPAYSDTRCGPQGKRAKHLAAKARRERRRAGRLEGAAARRARQSARRDARQARRLRNEARRCLAAVGPEANIARAQVNLPHGEFLDQGNLNKVCRKPVLLAGNCPRSAVYGRARAWTPLLDHPLEGYVYLVGGYGYKLPALVAELNGQIKVLLVGKVDSGRNHGIRNTFEVVPDAPVSRFVLEMKGGKRYGLLQNSEDLCQASKAKRRAIVRFTGQNGRVEQFKPVVTNECGKKRKAKKKHGRHGEAKAGGHGKEGKG